MEIPRRPEPEIILRKSMDTNKSSEPQSIRRRSIERRSADRKEASAVSTTRRSVESKEIQEIREGREQWRQIKQQHERSQHVDRSKSSTHRYNNSQVDRIMAQPASMLSAQLAERDVSNSPPRTAVANDRNQILNSSLHAMPLEEN